MHLIDNSTASNTQPAIGPVGPNPNSFFRPKNENLGQLATVIDVDWLNAVQNEIAAVIIGAGMSLSKATQNQMYTAINTLISNAVNASPSIVVKTVTQNGHGFTKGKVLYNANGTWTLAQADTLATSFSVGMVYEVVSTSVFKIIMLGYISGLPAGMNLTANTVYYLSTSVAGGLQTTRPASDGLFIKQVLITDSTTSGYFFNPQPLPFSTGGGGGGDLLAANNLDDLDDIPTARDNLGLGSAALEDTDAFISSDDYDDFLQASELTNILLKADNLFGLADAAQARINLGLGTIATYDIEDFASALQLENIQSQIDDINTDLDNYALITYVDSAVSSLTADISSLTTAVSGKQPLDATLTALAGVTTIANKLIYATDSDAFATTDFTSFGRTLAALANATDGRTALGVVINTDVQAYNAALASIAGLTTSADKMIYTTASNTYAVADLSTFARTILDDADASAVQTTLGLVIGANIQAWSADLDDLVTQYSPATSGTSASMNFHEATNNGGNRVNIKAATSLAGDVDLTWASINGVVLVDAQIGSSVQAWDVNLDQLAGLSLIADRLPYANGADTLALTILTSFARTILDDADASTARTTLGVAIGTNVQAYDDALASISGLTTSADKMIYTTASDTYAVTDLSSFARTLLDDTSAAAARTTLGLYTENYTVTANATMAVNNSYYVTSGTVELTLPTSAAVGDKLYIKGTNGCTGWVIKQGSGQSIWHGGTVTATGATGQIASSDKHDAIELVCTTANNVWESTGKGQGFLDVTTA